MWGLGIESSFSGGAANALNLRVISLALICCSSGECRLTFAWKELKQQLPGLRSGTVTNGSAETGSLAEEPW